MYDRDRYLRILLGIGALIFLGMWYIKGHELKFTTIGLAFSSAGITIIIIDKFLVKIVLWNLCPGIFSKWLTTIPYLGGKWEGEMESNYIFPETGTTGPPINAFMEIIHKFDSISIKLETEKSYSTSYLSDIIDENGGQKYLCYLYINDADKDREINPKHDGAVKLRIKHDGDVVLIGHYWTGRSTTGSMNFKRTDKKNSPY